MFELKFTSEPTFLPELNQVSAYGQITLGTFSESFLASMDYWDVTTYQEHWQEAAIRIREGYSTSTFITNMHNPQTANFITWWPVWVEGQTVYVQNQLLFLDKLSRPFDVDNPYCHIGKRNSVDADNHQISEWKLTVNEIIQFLSCANSEEGD